MAASTFSLTDADELKVKPVNWTNVRLIYKKMQDDFHLITEPFGISFDETTRSHLGHLIGTIDVIDRCLDDLDELEDRLSFGNSLVDYLAGKTETIQSKFVTKEIAWRMECLRTSIIMQDVQVEFCETVAKVLRHTEEKRRATTERKMIDEMCEEWRQTGHLTVLIMGKDSTPEFEKFFYLCCETMTAVDMIQDAREDFRSGHISVRPRLSLYLKLFALFIVPFPKLIWRFPKFGNLIRYAFSFLYEVYWPSRIRFRNQTEKESTAVWDS